MKEIKIVIPDNLTKAEETILIARKMAQKMLSGSARNEEQKKIGDQVKIIEPESVIRIIRKSTEKPITFCPCPVCGCEYQSNAAKYYFTNYGGNVRKMPVCSDKCAKTVVELFPRRTATSRNKLTALRFY